MPITKNSMSFCTSRMSKKSALIMFLQEESVRVDYRTLQNIMSFCTSTGGS